MKGQKTEEKPRQPESFWQDLQSCCPATQSHISCISQSSCSFPVASANLCCWEKCWATVWPVAFAIMPLVHSWAKWSSSQKEFVKKVLFISIQSPKCSSSAWKHIIEVLLMCRSPRADRFPSHLSFFGRKLFHSALSESCWNKQSSGTAGKARTLQSRREETSLFLSVLIMGQFQTVHLYCSISSFHTMGLH